MADKIVVFGAWGKLGRCVVEEALARGFEPVVLSKAIDIRDVIRVEQTLSIHKPIVAVNCAAFTHVDLCELSAKRAEVYSINALGPGVLATMCATFKIPLVHISSDYVFDSCDVPLAKCEELPTVPINEYGRSKLLGEENARINPQTWILRTSGIFGKDGDGLPQSIKRMLLAGDTLQFTKEVSYCPTWSVDLARTILEVIQKKIPFGLYHAAGSTIATPYQFACDVSVHVLGLTGPAKIEACSYEEAVLGRAPRPRWSVLACKKIEDAGVKAPGSYLDALKAIFK